MKNIHVVSHVPALAGTYACCPITEDDGQIKQISYEPIVAWVIQTEGTTNKPITILYPLKSDGEWEGAVKYPCGAIIEPYGITFLNEAHLIHSLNN